jgi:hypothetical protein
MKNNSHRETQSTRLARFSSGPPEEAIETLLNSIDNFFNNEIKITPDRYQTSLLFLGIHASILTIAEVFWGKGGHEGYKLFLEHFVDQDGNDKKFSLISKKIHNWRNILAHQWLGSMGHQIQYDYEIPEGWIEKDEILLINPAIYCESYLNAFSASGKIWDYDQIFSKMELEKIKQRTITKFIKH